MKISLIHSKLLFDFEQEIQNDDQPKLVTANVELATGDAQTSRIAALVKHSGSNDWTEVGYLESRIDGATGVTLKQGITFTVPEGAKWKISNVNDPQGVNSADFALVSQIN